MERPSPLFSIRTTLATWFSCGRSSVRRGNCFSVKRLKVLCAAGDREFSTGFMTDRDYRSENTSNELQFASVLGHSDILFARDDRAYGANQFYGPYVSWERTKGWFAALTQQLNPNTSTSAVCLSSYQKEEM